jgi:hypothetical protein
VVVAVLLLMVVVIMVTTKTIMMMNYFLNISFFLPWIVLSYFTGNKFLISPALLPFVLGFSGTILET